MQKFLRKIIEICRHAEKVISVFYYKIPEKYRQAVLVLVVLVFGILLMQLLASMRKKPAKKELEILAPLVNAQRVHIENMEMVVSGYGTIRPKTEVKVVPQVSGRVIKLSKNFVNGGYFLKDEVLITIDPKDYELAIEGAKADVASGQVRLDQEQAEAKIARDEWQQINPGTEPSSALVLREPQIRQARAQLQAAQASLATAELALERTKITEPFDGRVAQESVDLGQYLVTGQPIATVYATDMVEISVPLEDSELYWFDVKMSKNNHNSENANGSKAIVSAEFGGSVHSWQGHVARIEGQIDKTSRLVNVVVEVVNPFEMNDNRLALMPGMFVKVGIIGKKIENVVRVPRYSVHNNNEVWVVYEGRLNIQKVEIIRRDRKYAYVSSGIEDGDIIVTSSIDIVTDRMKIRVELEK